MTASASIQQPPGNGGFSLPRPRPNPASGARLGHPGQGPVAVNWNSTSWLGGRSSSVMAHSCVTGSALGGGEGGARRPGSNAAIVRALLEIRGILLRIYPKNGFNSSKYTKNASIAHI